MIEEIWEDIPGFEGLYQVTGSNYGQIKSLPRETNNRRCKKERLLKKQHYSNGYCYVRLYKDGHSYEKQVSRLVAEAFIPNPLGLPEVNHIDENKDNNSVENLEWCDHQYNVTYSAPRRWKKILQYTPSGEFVREWKSIKSVLDNKKFKISMSSLHNCLSGRSDIACGYIWKYKNPGA